MRNDKPWRRDLDRLLRDHTQPQVAEMLGVTDRAVRYWRRRMVEPRASVRVRIAAAAAAVTTKEEGR